MKLVLLRCPNCTEPLKPGNDDVVVSCTHCYTPVAIAVNGAVKMPVKFAVPAESQVKSKRWMPFWRIEGQARISKRETQGGRSQNDKAMQFWSTSRNFFVPAWELDPRIAQDVGSRLVQNPITLVTIEQPTSALIQTAVVTPNDAKKLIEFIVLAVEARRKDWLRDLNFDLETKEAELWAIPEDTYR